MLLWETLQTYHGSKDFRCGLMSLDASVSAALFSPPFPPFSPPPLPQPIMDQRIKVWPCVSRCFCVCCHSLPSPPILWIPFFLRREVTQPSTHLSLKQSVISPFLNCWWRYPGNPGNPGHADVLKSDFNSRCHNYLCDVTAKLPEKKLKVCAVF